MKYLRFAIIVAATWALINSLAFAQSVPPVQTINTNQGIACQGVSSQGAVTLCRPGVSYGCAGSVGSGTILAADGQRTSILFQDTGSIPMILTFGDQAVGNNGFVVQPGNSFLWSNLGAGNIPGRVPTTSIAVQANGSSTCVFLFTD